MKFSTYPISETLKKNLTQLGLKRPTDIQYKAIPSVLKGEDVLAVAQTGTGKTAAFAVPVIQRIQEKGYGKSSGLQCIVMVPTRELAIQIHKVFVGLCKNMSLTPFAVIGGVEQDDQIKALAEGIHILIATPGRMFDLISQGAIRLDKVRILILDEADQMLDKRFITDIQAIKKKLKHRHQTLFFSATINKEIKKLAFSQVSSNAVRIQVSPDDPVSKNVSHYVLYTDMDDKRFFLRRLIHDRPDAKIMVFVRTMVRAERVCKALARANISSLTIHRDKDQKERLAALSDFRAGRTQVLIATDVAARGIDIPNVDYVINYDLPQEDEVYVHRVGRTGRGRSKGQAVSFCSQEEGKLLLDIETYLNQKIQEVSVSKKEYSFTVDVSDGPESVREMILANEAWEKSARKKKKKSKK